MPGVFSLDEPGTGGQGQGATKRWVIDKLNGGWSTNEPPHLLPDNYLSVADNVWYPQDGLIAKRPGNEYYGGGNGRTGSGQPILAMTRFYSGNPTAGKLIVHSGNSLYVGNDALGTFAVINSGLTATRGATFAQHRDPDMTTGNAIALFVCDGVRIPQVYDGTNFVPVQTGGVFFPNGVVSGVPITPKFVVNWNEHMVYAGDPTDGGALYISDALRPERFTGFSYIDSAQSSYTPYYPGGAGGALGDITGIMPVGAYLVIFFNSGIVVAQDSGTYGALQYTFSRLSSSVGCSSPRSIVAFDSHLIFFGLDRFYATDGISIVALPDELPSVYSYPSRSVEPPEMRNKTSVVAVRRGLQYWAAYDAVGLGQNTRIVTFDISANGGWQYGASTVTGGTATLAGGAWARWPTGMPLGAAVECRGPGDTQQLFWGSSTSDLVAQHDVNTYDDFGAPIACEVRARSFFFDLPLWPKTVEALYLLLVYNTKSGSYTSALTPYVYTDLAQVLAPTITVTVTPGGVLYGTALYGTFAYAAQNATVLTSPKAYPQAAGAPCQGLSLAPGVSESSIYPFSIIGFALEVITDEPIP